MPTIRSSIRRRIDERLAGLDALVRSSGPRPPSGWIRTIRQALGMSTYELAERMGVSQPRVTQLEHAETIGTIRLGTLEQAAEALNCAVCYLLVPREPLEQMVHQQALVWASEMVASTLDEGLRKGQACQEGVRKEVYELARELVDRRGLWRHGLGTQPV